MGYLRFCCSVAKLCLTLCNAMDCSTPGFPVLHYLSEFAQTHVHWVGDAIQPSHPPSPPSPPALNLSQHQGLSQWVDPWHQVAQGLELQIYFLTDFWLCWVFIAVLGVHCCAWAFSLWQAGANLPCSVGASHCSVFSCCEAQALDLRASVVAACGLRRSGARAWLLHGMWALPGPGIKPVSLAL